MSWNGDEAPSVTVYVPGTRFANTCDWVGTASVGANANVAGTRPPVLEKLNEPAAPVAVFWITSRASFSLVNVQVMLAPGSTNAAGTVNTEPASVPNGVVFPVTAPLASEQVAPVIRHPAGTVSVSCTCVPSAVTVYGPELTGTPAAVVVSTTGFGAAVRLDVTTLKAPVPPTEVLATVTVAGRGVLVNVQVMLSLSAGVSTKLVPVPAGNTVADAAALEHEIEFPYWPSVLADPPAIDSLNVYVVPAEPVATVTVPPVMVDPVPPVVAVEPPAPATDITNWSVLLNRLTPPSDFWSTIRGGDATCVLAVDESLVSPVRGSDTVAVFETMVPAAVPAFTVWL